MTTLPIAVIGAGMAGIACARGLRAAGHAVQLFDKGRAPGGRVATRRATLADGTTLQFDHGAQYASARDPAFAEALRAAGAAPWPDPTRFVGTPGMSALARALAAGLEIATLRHVAAITGGPGAWMLRHHDAMAVRPGRPLPADAAARLDGPFAAVAVTIPAPQALPLVADLSAGLGKSVDGIGIAPCWTVMAAFPARLALPDWLRPGDGGELGWAAREGAKPGRAQGPERWVIQGGPAWSRARLEALPEQVIPALLAALANRAAAPLPEPVHTAAHRWRYALVERALGVPCLWDATARIGFASDGCLGGRVEAAWESGLALAAAMRAG
jgi:renalase